MRTFENLRPLGCEGGYDAVRRYASQWRKERDLDSSSDAHVPQSFDPGKAYQFDLSLEVVVLGGKPVRVKVAHVRLCHSRMFHVRAYPRKSREMDFDAHEKAFAFFGGPCVQSICDSMRTAVDGVFSDKDRARNARFLRMCSRYLVDPVACMPAAGWKNGQVENQMHFVRGRLFVPRRPLGTRAFASPPNVAKLLPDWLPMSIG